MKFAAPFFALVALALIAVGCSSTSGTSSTPFVPNQQNVAPERVAPADWGGGGGGGGGHCDEGQSTCGVEIVTALNFDGTNFTTPAGAPCGIPSVFHTTPYAAPTAGPVTLSGNVSVTPTCPPSSTNGKLYIVALQVPAHGGDAIHAAFDKRNDFPNVNVYAMAGPADPAVTPWSFAPMSPGLTAQAGAKYVFFIVDLLQPPVPLPSTAPIQQIITQVSYDGTNFSIVNHRFCKGHRGLGGANAYKAPASGPLTISSTLTFTPTCVPSPLPSISPMPQVYLVAVPLDGHGHGGGGGDGDAVPEHGGGQGHWSAVAIAGPANLNDNPWNMPPISPGLTMTAGQRYDFFIAVLRTPNTHPTPTPSPTPAPTATPTP